MTDPSIPIGQGYGESKWITEQLLDAAREKSGVRSSALRVGQIAGPVEKGVHGVWNRQEWLPSIIASSKYLGVIPTSLGAQDDIPWTPADLLSKVLVELLEKDCREDTEKAWTRYYHLTNPKQARWGDIVSVVQGFYSAVTKPKTNGHANGTNGNANGTSKTEIKAVSLQVFL